LSWSTPAVVVVVVAVVVVVVARRSWAPKWSSRCAKSTILSARYSLSFCSQRHSAMTIITLAQGTFG